MPQGGASSGSVAAQRRRGEDGQSQQKRALTKPTRSRGAAGARFVNKKL